MKKKFKIIPKFKSEDDEREFWATADTSKYFNWNKAIVNPSFPNLKMSTKTITFRITQSLYDDLKILANKKDVPYQSLLKVYLSEKVREEMKAEVYTKISARKSSNSMLSDVKGKYRAK